MRDSELNDRSMEMIIYSKKEKEKTLNKIKPTTEAWKLQNNFKSLNMWVTGVQEKETKMNEMEKIFEEMRQEISQIQ